MFINNIAFDGGAYTVMVSVLAISFEIISSGMKTKNSFINKINLVISRALLKSLLNL